MSGTIRRMERKIQAAYQWKSVGQEEIKEKAGTAIGSGAKATSGKENLTMSGAPFAGETTALRQFDNKLIELHALNRGRGGVGKKVAAMHNRIWMHFRSQRG